jgi:polar amino acid transport system substrate-binding protein
MRSLRFPLLLSAFAVAGCTMTRPEPTTIDPHPVVSRIRSRGEIVIGMSGNQPPLNTQDPSGAIVGLEPDIAQMLADSMGVKLRLVAKPFAELLPALDRGEIDAAMSGMTITPERNLEYAFVGPYFISGKSVLATAKSIKKLDETAELNSPETRLAYLAGSTSEIFVTEVLPRARSVAVQSYDEGVKLIIDRTVDALVADFPFCVLTVLKHTNARLVTLSEPFTYEPLGIALPANDPLFVNLVDNFLVTMEGTGRLFEMKARWFTDGPWLEEMEQRKPQRGVPRQSAHGGPECRSVPRV